jgi:hypothetical protein
LTGTFEEEERMIDTDKYPSGPDDERLMTLSNRELRLAVWAYGSELRNMKEDSTHTDAYTLEEVKRLRKENHQQWRQMNDLQEEINVLLRGDEEE